MHNVFNFSSFNIALNEMSNVFRSTLGGDLNLDAGWGLSPPHMESSISLPGLSGIGNPSFPIIDDMVLSPRRPLDGSVKENCQVAFIEKISERFELNAFAVTSFPSL